MLSSDVLPISVSQLIRGLPFVYIKEIVEEEAYEVGSKGWAGAHQVEWAAGGVMGRGVPDKGATEPSNRGAAGKRGFSQC